MDKKEFLHKNGYNRKIWVAEYDRVKERVNKLNREELVPKATADKASFEERQLTCSKKRAVSISKIAHEVFPKLCKGQPELTLKDFRNKDGTDMDKEQTAAFLNKHYRGKKIWQEVKSFINFVVNNTYSTSEKFDVLDLTTEEVVALETARENVKDSQKMNLSKIQDSSERTKMSTNEIQTCEDNHASVIGHPKNLIVSIINALPDDANLEEEGDVAPSVGVTISEATPEDVDKANFRKGILEKYRQAANDGQKFYLQKYISNWPNSRLFYKWEEDPEAFDKFVNERVDSYGRFKS